MHTQNIIAMIEYPYIPAITGEDAERFMQQTEYTSTHLRGTKAPSKSRLSAARRMFNQAGLFL